MPVGPGVDEPDLSSGSVNAPSTAPPYLHHEKGVSRLQMVLRCDCGFRVTAESEATLIAGARAHAREAHGTDVADEVVVALLRSHPHGDEEGTIRQRRPPGQG